MIVRLRAMAARRKDHLGLIGGGKFLQRVGFKAFIGNDSFRV